MSTLRVRHEAGSANHRQVAGGSSKRDTRELTANERQADAEARDVSADARGVRLGCEFLRAGGDAVRALQRFIDHTQKRGKLLALD